MFGSPTGPCSPRPRSPSPRRSVSPPPYNSVPESPRRSVSPRASSLLLSGRSWQDCTTVELPVAWRREGRICVHADTNGTVLVYPNFVFDPEGEVAIAHKPGTFPMTLLLNKQSESINFAGQATGMVVVTPGEIGRTLKQARFGSFFQVSPTRALATFHTFAGTKPATREVWLSKHCSVSNWEAVLSAPRFRNRYLRRARIVEGCEEERAAWQTRISERHAVNGLSPVHPVDVVVLELPPDFANDPYLKPLPRLKLKTIKKIGIVAYNHKEARNEDQRLEIYYATQGIPQYDAEGKFIHFENKSLSTGIAVHHSDQYIEYEASLLDGASGGPLISLTRPHYFWGIHCCAFVDAEPGQQPKSRNFNSAISFYHPAVIALYQKFVLHTLPDAERAEVLSAI